MDMDELKEVLQARYDKLDSFIHGKNDFCPKEKLYCQIMQGEISRVLAAIDLNSTYPLNFISL